MATMDLETTVNVDKSSLLSERKEKIRTLFNVLLSLDELMHEDKMLTGEMPTIQWIKLTGTQNDCQNAMVQHPLVDGSFSWCINCLVGCSIV